MLKRIAIISLVIAAIAASWILGRASGIRHAIYDGAAWATDWGVWYEIDGQVHWYQ